MSLEALLTDDESLMEIALQLAADALAVGDLGIGAVVFDENKSIIAGRHDEVRSSGDPTAHAVALALRDAASAEGTWRLLGSTLVVTREPCALCAGAALSARIMRVVVGARDERFGCLGSRYQIGADPRLNHEFAVEVDVLAGRCEEIFGRSLLGGDAASRRGA